VRDWKNAIRQIKETPMSPIIIRCDEMILAMTKMVILKPDSTSKVGIICIGLSMP